MQNNNIYSNNKIQKFYKNTENAPPHKNIIKFLELEKNTGNAIDIGCGAGRDTVYLIKNNWKVLAIDRENVKETIEEKLSKKELENFKFECQKFENIKLPKADLIISNYSLPFCNKNNFNELWKRIVESIKENGYFVGTFFGINDSWINIKDKMVFLSKDAVLELFNEFEIISFEEIEKDEKTGLGIMKHWHIYDIIARKANKKL